jgi:hypothetical protein
MKENSKEAVGTTACSLKESGTRNDLGAANSRLCSSKATENNGESIARDVNMLRVVELDGGGRLRKASPKRDWMDRTGGHAYRCLPLVMSNQLGWEIILPGEVVAYWEGEDAISSVKMIQGDEWACSHFGHGVLTFHVWMLFRTPKDVNLLVTGPANNPKANIAPLEGMVETDWAPMSFTMNWKFTKIDAPAIFLAGEAIARVFPFPRGYVESFELERIDFEHMPVEERAAYEDWTARRTAWFKEQHGPNEWMRDYVRGAREKPGKSI